MRILKIAQSDANDIPVYHGSLSGKNNETIESFRNGATPSGQGLGGQKGGFFVWSTKTAAQQHALKLLNQEVEKATPSQGKPIVVTVTTRITPEDWDIDYELCGRMVLPWLVDNFNLLQQIPDNILQAKDGLSILPSRCRRIEGGITIALQYNGRISFKTARFDVEGQMDLKQASLLGLIFDHMQEAFPQKTRPLEQQILQKAQALKYVGRQPLQVTRIEVLQDGQWITA